MGSRLGYVLHSWAPRRHLLTVIAGVVLAPVLLAQVDITLPQVVNVTINPAAIDTRSSPQNITFTAQITDDLSGVWYGYGYIYSPSRRQYQYFSLSRTAGTALDGTWAVTLQVPQFTESGSWTVELYIRDNVSNLLTLTASDLQAKGFPFTFSVISNPDTTPPTLTSLSIVPSVIDVSSQSQQVTLTIGIADNLSGATFNYCNQVRLRSPSSRQSQPYIQCIQPTRVSGTGLDGTWQLTFTVPRHSEPGVWSPSITLRDAAGNYVSLNPAGIGFPATLTVTSSPADVTPPLLTGLSFSPAFINTTLGSQVVTVTVDITDDLSGVLDLSVYYTGYGPYRYYAYLYFTSPSGQQQWGSGYSSLIAGSPLNGRFQAQITFPRYSESGTWKISYLYLVDAVTNFTYLATADLQQRNMPTDLVIILPSGVSDGTVGPGGGTITDTVFGSRAQITIPPNGVSTNTSVAIDVLQNPPAVPIPQGFSGAGSFFVNVELVPHPSGLLPPPGMSLTIPLTTTMTPGSPLVLWRIDPITGMIPASSVTGGWVIGSVNADGTSASFPGIATLSTVVGLIQTAAVPGDLDGNNKLDCADVAIVRAAFGKRLGQSGYAPAADTNRDGIINIVDLAFVMRLLPSGTSCTSASSATPLASGPLVQLAQLDSRVIRFRESLNDQLTRRHR